MEEINRECMEYMHTMGFSRVLLQLHNYITGSEGMHGRYAWRKSIKEMQEVNACHGVFAGLLQLHNCMGMHGNNAWKNCNLSIARVFANFAAIVQ